MILVLATADRIVGRDLATDFGPADLDILETDSRIQQYLLKLAVGQGDSRRFAVGEPIEPAGTQEEKKKQSLTMNKISV